MFVLVIVCIIIRCFYNAKTRAHYVTGYERFGILKLTVCWKHAGKIYRSGGYQRSQALSGQDFGAAPSTIWYLRSIIPAKWVGSCLNTWPIQCKWSLKWAVWSANCWPILAYHSPGLLMDRFLILYICSFFYYHFFHFFYCFFIRLVSFLSDMVQLTLIGWCLLLGRLDPTQGHFRCFFPTHLAFYSLSISLLAQFEVPFHVCHSVLRVSK